MNSKYCRIILFLFYTIVSIACFLFVLRVIGIPISIPLGILLTVGWVMYCIFSAPYYAGYFLFRHQPVRKPTTAEAKMLKELISEVQSRSGFRATLNLLVIESNEINAYATGSRTIAISKGTVEQLSPDEIKGIFAHELGHTESGDCRFGLAFSTALSFPGRIFKFRPKKLKYVYLPGVISLAIKYGVALFLLMFILYQNTGPAMVVIIFILFPKFERLIRWGWTSATRFREYRQDAFAHSLGYGQFLLSALTKISASGVNEVNQYQIIMKHKHPIIYNRMERLEKLVGKSPIHSDKEFVPTKA